MTSLQEEFLAAGGGPLRVDEVEVVQGDRIALRHATVHVSARKHVEGQGIALKAGSGRIKLSDGRAVRLVHIWFDGGLPLTVSHEVECKDGELRVWNVYRVTHSTGLTTEESWTGNAGMVITEKLPSRRHYLCSPGTASRFDPQLEVVIEVDEIP